MSQGSKAPHNPLLPFHPISTFELGPVALSSHGVFFILGALVARATAAGSLEPEERSALDESVGAMVLAGGLGARLAFIVSHPFMWSMPSRWWRFWEGGMVSYGGLVGALIALGYLLRRRGLAIDLFFDRASPALLLGWGVGRLGCFLTWYGEEGKPGSVPWALLVEGTPYHPVQIYLIAMLWAGAFLIARFPLRARGRRAAAALLWYAGARAVSDHFRNYDPWYLQTASQITCLGLGTPALLRLTPRGAKKIPSPECGIPNEQGRSLPVDADRPGAASRESD